MGLLCSFVLPSRGGIERGGIGRGGLIGLGVSLRASQMKVTKGGWVLLLWDIFRREIVVRRW